LNIDTEETETSLLDLLLLVAENAKLLMLGPIAAGLIVLGIGFAQPRTYTSQANLNLTGDSAKSVEAMMRSPAVLDAVLVRLPAGGTATDAARDALSRRLRVSTVTTGPKPGASVARLEVDDENPQRAQAMANALIDAWLEAAKPAPVVKQELERKLKLTQSSLDDVSRIIAGLTKQVPGQMKPNLQYELDATVASLLKLHNDYVVALIELQSRPGSRDVVVASPPTLPNQPASQRKVGLNAIVTALATGFALLLWLYVRHAWMRAATNPKIREKQVRLRAALGMRARG
jgi:hypothetical protein